MIKKLVLIVLLFPSICFGTDIYVDPFSGAETDCADYDPTQSSGSRCGAGSYQMYDTLQEAVTNMSGGDDIYIRGGTLGALHLTGNASDGTVEIPQSKDGTSENWSSIQSYVGEWAILDGEDECGTGNDAGGVLAHWGYDKDGTDDIRYWRFERLEITGGAADDGGSASGLYVNGGPFILRYCYIHDNLATVGGANPCAWKGMVVKNTTVEYNVFRDNGTTGQTREIHSGTSLQWHSDYLYQEAYWERIPDDIPRDAHGILAVRGKNVIRYNLIDNPNQYAENGLHNKGRQYFTPKTNVDYEFEDWGEDIHHNIFIDVQRAVGYQGDFTQIHHNIGIITNGSYNMSGFSGIDETFGSDVTMVTVYNNTVIGGRICSHFGRQSIYTTVPPTPFFYVFNNLIDSAPATGDEAEVINLGAPYMTLPPDEEYNPARQDVENNYLYRADSNNVRVTREVGDCLEVMTVSEYDTCYSATNYTKATSEGSDNLYVSGSGSDQYVTRGAHVIDGAVTIANGGKGGAHPYLDGVTLPSYTGATNPSDNDWVDEVYNFDVAYFTAKTTQGDAPYDESFIEGAEAAAITGSISGGAVSGGIIK